MKQSLTKIILILCILFLILLFYNKLYYENFDSNKSDIFAIHSVFIAKENILFLEQWIDYHIQLGFNKFYLYDNSKVQISGGMHVKSKVFETGKVNKYNINYNNIVKLSDNEIKSKMNKIKQKYNNIIIIEWSPKDKNGIIQFNQTGAHNDCLKRMKNDNVKWCANIDMDEFIVINNIKTIQNYINELDSNISAIKLGQIRFESRFSDVNKLVIDINNVEKINDKFLSKHHSPKHIYNVTNSYKIKIHSWKGNGKIIHPNQDSICFNHYKLNKSHVGLNNIYDNIDHKIKKTIYKNSKNYIKII